MNLYRISKVKSNRRKLSPATDSSLVLALCHAPLAHADCPFLVPFRGLYRDRILVQATRLQPGMILVRSTLHVAQAVGSCALEGT